MKAVVTGSSGFIGSHLIKALVQRGFQVACLLRRDRKRTAEAPSPTSSRVQRYLVDYHDLSSLLNTEALQGADFVFHLAGITKAATLKRFLSANLLPTRNLLKAIRLRNLQLKRFLLLSSAAVAGPAEAPDRPVNPAMIPRPVEFYGRSKLAAEKALQRYAPWIPYTIIRPSPVYGPRDRDFLNIFRQLHAGVQIFPVNRFHLFSIIYVQDLVAGILRAVTPPATVGRTYFLCNDRAMRWDQFYRRIAELMNRRIWLSIHVPKPLSGGLASLGDIYCSLTGRGVLINTQKKELAREKYWICSNREAKADFGFRACYSISRGLEETLAWYRRHHWL